MRPETAVRDVRFLPVNSLQIFQFPLRIVQHVGIDINRRQSHERLHGPGEVWNDSMEKMSSGDKYVAR